MKSKAHIALLLSLLITSSTFSLNACGKPEQETKPTSDTSETESSSATETEPETETRIPDNLPDKNYEGYNFRLAHFREWVEAEEMTGDPINDALYERNAAFMNRYNVKMEISSFDDYGECTTTIRNMVKAGTHDYDYAFLQMVSAAGAAPDGIFYDYNALPYVDPSKPWWDKDCLDAFTIGGKCMLLSGVALPRCMMLSACLGFNKSLFDERNIPYPYSIVDEGKWTLDTLYDMTKDATQDLDGDGEDDFYGLTSWYADSPFAFYYGAGGTVVAKGEDGLPVVDLQMEHNVALYEKIYNVVRGARSLLITDVKYFEDAFHEFQDGHALFCCLTLSKLPQEDFRAMEQDYGLVPMPKFDENQAEYRSFVNGSGAMATVPRNVEDPERTGILVEALSSISYDYTYNAIYDASARTKYSRDADTLRMMELIMAHRAFDFSYAFLYANSAVSYTQSNLARDNTDIASQLRQSEKSLQSGINRILKSFEKNYGTSEE